jgi:hypothetical protein
VYDWIGPDGLAGGSPHLHLTCTEGYVVLSGRGSLQTLGGQGYRETSLEPGSVTWFSPGTVHRLVNQGDLRIVVMMENRLPDAGDHVLAFPPDFLRSEEDYAQRAVQAGVAGREEDWVRRRRDLAVEGFLEWKARVGAHGPAALADLYTAAVRLAQPRLGAWLELYGGDGPQPVRDTRHALRSLAEGRSDHLATAGVRALTPRTAPRYGLCGLLRPYDHDGL